MVRGGGETSPEEGWASTELERDLERLVIEESWELMLMSDPLMELVKLIRIVGLNEV